MRIYKDCLEMIKEVERDLFEMGITYDSDTVQDQKLEGKDKLTLELSPYVYSIFTNNNRFEKIGAMLYYKKEDKKDFIQWVTEEAIERVKGCKIKNPGEAWETYKIFWSQFLKDGKFSYTYVERIQEQIDYVINELKLRPNSRQAVITMYDRHQDLMNWGGRDRVPCSLTYHFLLRNNKLSLIYSQRSCDFIKFFQADVYCSIYMLQYIAEQLNCKIKSFTHVLNSLHAFKKDLKGVF